LVKNDLISLTDVDGAYKPWVGALTAPMFCDPGFPANSLFHEKNKKNKDIITMTTTTQCYGPKMLQCQDALSTGHGGFQRELASPSALAVVWKRANGPPAVGRMCIYTI
jgi:hypothetical protein